MTELLNPKSSEIDHFFFGMILLGYLGHGIFHPVVAILFFSTNQFSGEVF